MSRRHFRADVALDATDQGGRSGPLEAGYRSLLRFDGIEKDFGAELSPDSGSLWPGTNGNASVSVWAGKLLPPVCPGTTFEVREGGRIVGRGTIID